MKTRVLVLAITVTLVTLAAVGTAAARHQQTAAVSGKLSYVGVWTGPEQKRFQAVLNGFHKKFPGVSVTYHPAGDNVPTVLATAVQGGNPPDVASVSQPGLVKDFASRHALKSIDFARAAIAKNYQPSWIQLGTISGHLYSLFFKGANKSTVWYSVSAFKNAGVTPPTTWPGFLKAAATLRASGVPAFSLGGADGWTLTDL